MKLLNPFAFKLERREKRFCEIDAKPIYQIGEYKTYNFSSGTHKWFITCRGNIIITETTAVPKKLIEALVNNEDPSDSVTRHHYQRTTELWPYALECARQVNFEVRI